MALTNDEIIDAIAEEMDRALAKLELPGAPKPYHISYKITEVVVNGPRCARSTSGTTLRCTWATLDTDLPPGGTVTWGRAG